MNKTLASISAAVVFGGTSLSAIVPAAADLGVTSDLTYASEYVFRGIERADESFQPSLEASVGDFYAGLWGNLPIRSGQQSELNYYGGFALDVPGLEMLTLDVGATVYHWPRAGLDRTHEAFVGTKFENFGIHGVSAAVYYFYDFDVRSHVVEGSVGYSFALAAMDIPASIDVSALYGNQFGSQIEGHPFRGSENYHYYGASAELPWQLNEFSTLTAGVHYQTAEHVSLLGGGRGKNAFWTISYTAGF